MTAAQMLRIMIQRIWRRGGTNAMRACNVLMVAREWVEERYEGGERSEYGKIWT